MALTYISGASCRLIPHGVQRLLTAWSLVRVRPGEPNLRRAVGETAGGLSRFERKRRFA
jgi:hypothetical protein